MNHARVNQMLSLMRGASCVTVLGGCCGLLGALALFGCGPVVSEQAGEGTTAPICTTTYDGGTACCELSGSIRGGSATIGPLASVQAHYSAEDSHIRELTIAFWRYTNSEGEIESAILRLWGIPYHLAAGTSLLTPYQVPLEAGSFAMELGRSDGSFESGFALVALDAELVVETWEFEDDRLTLGARVSIAEAAVSGGPLGPGEMVPQVSCQISYSGRVSNVP